MPKAIVKIYEAMEEEKEGDRGWPLLVAHTKEQVGFVFALDGEYGYHLGDKNSVSSVKTTRVGFLTRRKAVYAAIESLM